MKLLNIKMIGSVFVIITLSLFVSLAQEMNRRIQVQREVRKLEQQVADMQQSVIELENLNQYFRTDAYQERLAREKLNYRAPGEQVVLIPTNDTTTNTPSAADQAQTPPSPLEQWWRAFFVPDLG